MKFTKAIELNKNGTLTKKIGTNLFTVNNNFIWYLDYELKKIKAVVRKGFETDFGSIPRIFWWFLNPTKYVAYILHDFIYEKKYVENGRRYNVTRWEADNILYEALKVEKMIWIKRFIVRLGVRMGGWVHRYGIYNKIFNFIKKILCQK